MKHLLKQLWPLWYRAQFFADVPGVLQHLAFRKLRRRYFEAMWREAAAAAGASFAQAEAGYWRIGRDGMTAFVRNSDVSLDSHLLLDIMGDKAMTHALLSEMAVGVPKALKFSLSELPEAEAFLLAAGGAIVVKPSRGTGGGRGVTTGVRDADSLRRAARYAARSGPSLFAEAQIEGRSYRLLYIGGAFVDAVRRDPPVVTGDGRRTIRALIRAENRLRLSGLARALSPLKADRDCTNHLKSLGLTLSTVLKAGETIAVKRAVNENDSRGNHSVRDQVHPATVALGQRIVARLGLELAGLDLICEDIARPLDEANGYINEINTTPGLHHHVLIADPASGVPAARLVLDYMFKAKRGVMMLGGEPARRFTQLPPAERRAV